MKHSIIYGLGFSLNTLLSFLMIPIYTRFLNPTDYGIKELLGLSVDVIGTLLGTAIAAAFFRFYFEYDDEKDRNEVISTAIISFGSFALASIVLLSFASRLMARLILDDAEYYYFFLIAFASMWFNGLVEIGYNYLRANRKSGQFVMYSGCKLLLALSLNIYLVVVLRLGVLGILISNLVSSVLICIIIMLPVVLNVKLRFSSIKMKEMVKFGVPVIPSQMGAFVVHLSDRFFIKAFGSIADAGLYSLGYRFGTLGNSLITGPFNQVWTPRRFEIYKEKDSERIFGQVFTYFCLILFFVGLGISVLTKDVLMIVADREFWSAYKVVPIMVVASTIFSFHYHFSVGIAIAKKTKYFAYVDGSNAILVLVLNYFMIQKFGVWGAATVMLCAMVYKVSLIYLISNRYLKIHFEWARVGKLAGTCVILYLACSFFGFENVWVNLICKGACLCQFPVVLVLIGFFTEEERMFIRAFLGRVGTGLPWKLVRRAFKMGMADGKLEK